MFLMTAAERAMQASTDDEKLPAGESLLGRVTTRKSSLLCVLVLVVFFLMSAR